MAAVVETPWQHTFRRDRELGYDRRGRAYCVCGLPETSHRHRAPTPIPPGALDHAQRAAGERPDR